MFSRAFFSQQGILLLFSVLIFSLAGCCKNSNGLGLVAAVLVGTSDDNRTNTEPEEDDGEDIVTLVGLIQSPSNKHKPVAKATVYLSTPEYPTWNACKNVECAQYQDSKTISNGVDIFKLQFKGIKTAELKEGEEFRLRLSRSYSNPNAGVEAFEKEWSFSQLGIKLTDLDAAHSVTLHLE